MNLFLLFIYTTILSHLIHLFFPTLPLFFYIPFLIICFYRTTRLQTLWWAIACGFIIDLFSSNVRLGSNSLAFCLTAAYLYRYKFQFFEDRLSTLPVMTFFFSVLVTIILSLFYYMEGIEGLMSWKWVKYDLILTPLKESSYAFLLFSLPTLLLSSSPFRRALFRRKRRRA